MNKKLDITAIILTFNEELHIARCLDNVSEFCQEILVIDCFSTDKTVEIVKSYDNVQLIQHQWPGNQAQQFNWALDNCEIKTKWILRLDADEYFYSETIHELCSILPDLSDNYFSISISRDRVWMGRTIKFGTGEIILKRIFRTGTGRSEQRIMDECIVTDGGDDIILKGKFADDNLQNLSIWTQKHLNYAIREAAILLDNEFSLSQTPVYDSHKNAGTSSMSKRKIKNLYAKLPLFWRAFAYFIYRYFLRLGFLEGKEGFCWHFFQGLWYRMLVDAKLYEVKKNCGKNPEKIRKYLKDNYNITL